jgi:hypothetical protein
VTFCASNYTAYRFSSFSSFFERPKKEAKKSLAYDAFATTLIPSLSAVALAKAVTSRNPSRSGFRAI